MADRITGDPLDREAPLGVIVVEEDCVFLLAAALSRQYARESSHKWKTFE